MNKTTYERYVKEQLQKAYDKDAAEERRKNPPKEYVEENDEAPDMDEPFWDDEEF